MSDYENEARSDAVSFIDEYMDEIKRAIKEDGRTSTDLMNDYGSGNSFIHESFTDRSYSLREAIDVLEDLDDYEETDSGLWEGRDMKEALSTCAAYTYSNAVQHFIVEMIDSINDSCEYVRQEVEDEWAQELEDKDPPDVEDLIDEAINEKIKSVVNDYK